MFEKENTPIWIGMVLMAGFFLLCAGNAIAQTTWTVDQVGGDFTTIQSCVDAAVTGDTCRVNPGTYAENIDFAGKNITLVSTAGPEVTVIDGGGSGSVVTIENAETQDAVLDGFTITNGYSYSGGGIICRDSSPRIENCLIAGNTADDDVAPV